MKVAVSRVNGTCGLGVVFSFNNPHKYHPNVTTDYIKTYGGGIGYNVAGFIDTQKCKKVYNWLSENYTIVFQSPVKRNKHSGNQFFFIVFKEEE